MRSVSEKGFAPPLPPTPIALTVLLMLACNADHGQSSAGAAQDGPGAAGRLDKPPPGPEDPSFKFLARARSSDGRSWEPMPGVLAERASSPQLLDLGGVSTVVFVSRGNHLAQIPFNADSGQEAHELTIQGQEAGLVVDPHMLPLGDGRYRLYYLYQPEGRDPGRAGNNQVRSAISRDLRTWEREPGVRLEGGFVDPDVVRLPGGGFRMYLTRGAETVMSAISPDGLEFILEDGSRLLGGGVTSTLYRQPSWLMYYHVRNRIHLATSPDGLAFEADPRPLLQPEHPDVVGAAVESPSVLVKGDQWYMVYASSGRQGLRRER